MEVDKALNEVAFIRRQLGQVQVFRGYRSSAAGLSAVLAALAAWAQARWVPEPAAHPGAFVGLWAAAAALAILAAAGPMVGRALRHDSPFQRDKTFSALGMLVPSIAAGAAVTTVLLVTHAEVLWLLPGLWAVLLSLGLFASLPVLPRPTVGVAAYYLAAGILAMGLLHGDAALAPWVMATTFGVGQLLAAGVLYFCLERPSWASHLDEVRP